MSQCAAKRRRRQAVNGFRHLAPLGRPVYHIRAASKLDARIKRRIELERMIQARKGASKR